MTTSRSNRWAQLALTAALFFVGLMLTIIVSLLLWNKVAFDDGVREYRKEVVAGEVQRLRVPGVGTLDYQRLFEEVSEPGESMDAFAVRLAPRLRDYSDETGFEACGVIATDGERFGAIIGTNRAHIACANFHSKVPAGMRATGETIHSHGTERQFNANRNDRALQGEQLAGVRGGVRGVGGQRLDAFSAMDYEGGPGYLATPNGVIHQRGSGSVRPAF